MRSPAQVLTDLLDKLTALLTLEVNPVNRDQHNAEVVKVREKIEQAKVDQEAEDVRMAAEQAALDV